MPTAGELRLSRVAEAFAAKSNDTRHKCFLSYHSADADAVADFVASFGDVFIPKVIGLSESDPLIGSKDTDYIMDRIREKYLTDSTVTIVLLGQCTWSRRFVDWEVYSSLRRGKVNRLNGLMAVNLPSIGTSDASKLPSRVDDNLPRTSGPDKYARWYRYPASSSQLKGWVQDAFDARTSRNGLINNTRARKINSSPCE
jgi:hypothetical protein